MADNARAGRMAKRIKTIVASAIEHEIKDSRLEYVTITDVSITGDLHDATVFYTVRGPRIDAEPDVEMGAEALKRARGKLRKKVGDELGVRYTPTLSFKLDTVPQDSAHLEQLLERARERDAELAKLKQSAKPAGDPNPYKVKATEEDEDS